MADQDLNAANVGDMLKHCLLADILNLCIQQWTEVNFSETHAGAGKYSSASQATPRDHINKLRSQVKDCNVAAEDLGWCYWKLLDEWWSTQSNETEYPGSSLQAAILLSQRLGNNTASIHVTENDPEIHERLQAALSQYQNCQPVLDGFQEQIELLTQPDDLVILLDPYGYAFNESGINEGGLNLQAFLQVLEPCWSKSACVIGFWCATTQDGSTQKLRRLFSLALQLYAEQFKAVYRRFMFSSYTIEWIGIGRGESIVKDLPSGDWTNSWLHQGIKERPLHFSIFAANRTNDDKLIFKDFQE
jgi:hypothetical protein